MEGVFWFCFKQDQQLAIMCVNKMFTFIALFQYLLMSLRCHKPWCSYYIVLYLVNVFEAIFVM